MSVKFALALPAAALALALVAQPSSPALAQASAAAKADDLTEEEKAERELRKSCKVAICAAMRNRKAAEDVSCNIVKTWRKEHLDKMVAKAGTSWPWGKVKCTAPIKLGKDMLTKALGEAKFEAQLAKHEVHCEVERQEGKADIRFEFSPKVSFENGKAVKASLNWGKVEAPTLVKGAMWTATATDNTFNVLQGTVVEDINDFTSNKCDEVKEDWQGK